MKKIKIILMSSVSSLSALCVAGCTVYMTDNPNSGYTPYPAADRSASLNTSLPPGTYQNSCRDMYTSHGWLHANCFTVNQALRSTSLYYENCHYDIANKNGRLVCAPQSTPFVPIPPGSYQASCRHIKASQSTLYADCQTANGGWQHSRLNYGNCHSDIANNNGHLVCGAISPAYPPSSPVAAPAGSYQASCQRIQVRGHTLSARCQTAKGKWHDSSLSYQKCHSDIANQNGHLVC